MGGDHAPHEVVAGALTAAHAENSLEILIVGQQDRLESELESQGGAPDNLSVVHAPDAIAMGESPVEAVKKRPEASILVACGLVREGRAQALIAAGSTGATVAACAMKLKRLKGVRRPGIAVPMPSGNRHGITLLMDAGANPACRPHHLQQYAVMGANYYREMWGEKNPRVALVSIGEEDTKGTSLTKEAATLLRETDVNFVGNVEQIFSDRCEVALADGFVGNIVLKTAEAVGEMVFGMLAEVVAGSDPVAFKNIASRMDYAEFGGAPLLGVDGTVLICHGRSDRKAIANAIRAGARAVGHHVNDNIVKGLTRAPAGAET
jgi:glycerol-3-phosphate acyltransferase PlsX